MSRAQRVWVVWAGARTRGFATKVEAERWAQSVEAFFPRARVKVQRVTK